MTDYDKIKTKDWQTATDLRFDKTFPINYTTKIIQKLIEMQPKMPEYIKYIQLKPGTMRLCLHRNGRKEFLMLCNVKTYSPKTKDWYSTTDLIDQGILQSKDFEKIRKELTRLQPQMPKYIQYRVSKPKNIKVICIHKKAINEFLNISCFKQYPIKTNEWLSISELTKKEYFCTLSLNFIKNKLKELQPQMPQFIQKRKIALGKSLLCLHYLACGQFLEKCGVEFYPPKTDEWLSAYDLKNDPEFPMGDSARINDLLIKMQPQMPQFIQKRKPKRGRFWVYCLHRDGIETLMKLCNLENVPPKTEIHLSAGDLSKNPDFPMGDISQINNLLLELYSKYQNIVERCKPRTGAKSVLYLRRDAFELVKNLIIEKRYKIFAAQNTFRNIQK